MNHQVTSQKAQTILTLLFILLAVCLLSGVPAQAAGVSMSDVTTSSGGKFVKRDGKWMYRQKDGSYAKDCLLEKRQADVPTILRKVAFFHAY